jgi:hypothetical protein
VKLAEHEPDASVHVCVAFARPAPFAVNVTEPPGVLLVPDDVSVTVAEQLDA